MTISLNTVQDINNSTSKFKDLKTNFDLLKDNQILLKDYICAIEESICDITNLNTEDKSCVVNAINEIHGDLDTLNQTFSQQISNIVNSIVFETLVDNGNSTYTWDNRNGTSFTFSTEIPNADGIGFDPFSHYTSTTVQDIVEEIANEISNLDFFDLCVDIPTASNAEINIIDETHNIIVDVDPNPNNCNFKKVPASAIVTPFEPCVAPIATEAERSDINRHRFICTPDDTFKKEPTRILLASGVADANNFVSGSDGNRPQGASNVPFFEFNGKYYIDTGIICKSRADNGAIGQPKHFVAVVDDSSIVSGPASVDWWWYHETSVVCLTHFYGPQTLHICVETVGTYGSVAAGFWEFEWELYEVII